MLFGAAMRRHDVCPFGLRGGGSGCSARRAGGAGAVDGVEEDLGAGGHVADLDGTLEEGGVAAGGASGAAGAEVGVVREALGARLVGHGGARPVQLEGLDEGVAGAEEVVQDGGAGRGAHERSSRASKRSSWTGVCAGASGVRSGSGTGAVSGSVSGV